MRFPVVLVGAFLVAIFAFAHLERLFFPYTIQLGHISVPYWSSFIFYLVSATLAAFMFSACKKRI